MKKTVCSIVALLITSILLLGGIAPTFALALDGVNLQDTSTRVTASDIPISERYHVIKNGYLGKYDLQEGIFGHQSAMQMNKNAVYFYSDGYFTDSPETYNSSLATMSLALSLSAFNTMQTDFDFSIPAGYYSNLFRHAKVLMSDIGFADKDIFVNDSFDIKPTEESIGMIMSAKKISLDDGDYILIPIAVRGGDYEAEWASNTLLGANGESLGFSNSATKVVEQVESYINSSTTFDISSALNEGRVKFWIVGYSRGGAVANIAAKRLTDVYGQTGNDIYSYTFEAPAGGVDGTEFKAAWTYNGIYSNIHNIINPGDLIPKIPPKQMGFKRYGVDHYVPGTDAGEIKASTYVTPTGITVTTYADNEAYIVGNADYNDRRSEMLHYLSAIDSSIEFSDSFSLATIDLKGAIFNGSYAIKSLEEKSDITCAEWLDCFIDSLLNWAANGTYNYGQANGGGYGNDYRDFYTTNSKFAGQEYVTLEVALQNVLKLGFSLQYSEKLGNDMLYRLLSLSSDYLSILDLYMNAIQKWGKLSESKQKTYLDKIWNYLDRDLQYSDGTPVTKISDLVASEEREQFKESVYTLTSFLLLFIYKDSTTNPGINGISETQTYLVTLFYNAMTIIQGHYPEICLAWLSTYDENYSLENRNFADTEVNLISDDNNIAPEVEAKIKVMDNQSTVYLSSIINSNTGVDANSKNNGSAIYYAIFENGTMVEDWQLYRAPITIDISDGSQYSLKAFAARFEEMGEVLEITSEQLRIPTEEPNDSDIDNPPIETPPPEETPTTETQTDVWPALLPYVIVAGIGFVLIISTGIIMFKMGKKKK